MYNFAGAVAHISHVHLEWLGHRRLSCFHFEYVSFSCRRCLLIVFCNQPLQFRNCIALIGKKVASILLEFFAVLFFGNNDVAISSKGTSEICQIQQLDAICSGRNTIYRLNWFHAFILDGFKHHHTSKIEPTAVLWMNAQTVYVAFRPPGILWNIFSLIIVGCTWDMSCYA